jgi:hypothetical protein
VPKQEILSHINRGEHFFGQLILRLARLLMLAGLLQVGALGGAIQGQLALLTATLRADAVVQRRAEALLLANMAYGTAQAAPRKVQKSRRIWPLPWRGYVKRRMDVDFSSASVEKTA